MKETGRRLSPDLLDEFTVYPNPANDILYITSKEDEDVEIMIYDVKGQMVQQVSLPAGSDEIDISKLVKGLYLINIQVDDEVFTKKIIKN